MCFRTPYSKGLEQENVLALDEDVTFLSKRNELVTSIAKNASTYDRTKFYIIKTVSPLVPRDCHASARHFIFLLLEGYASMTRRTRRSEPLVKHATYALCVYGFTLNTPINAKRTIHLPA